MDGWAAELSAFVQVVVVDLVLAGDNAIVVGMVAAGLPRHQRARVIALGIVAATLMRVAFALVTVQLLQIVGLVLAGGLLLLWVCWKLWREIESTRRAERAEREPTAGAAAGAPAPAVAAGPPKTVGQAAFQIVVADLSMSLDNVLAVAGIAREHAWVLVAGLALSVAFMGLAAGFIARLLERHHWIAYVGLLVILYVSIAMIVEGAAEISLAAAAVG